MLVVYFGNNRTEVYNAGAAYLADASRDRATHIDEASFVPGIVTNMIQSQSFFSDREYFLLDTPSAEPEFAAEVKSNLKELAESPNVFVVLEGSLLAPAKASYSKVATLISEFSDTKTEAFNRYALTDALAAKDKRQLWVQLMLAKQNHMRDEEIIGLLWWQLKALRLAELTSSADAAGLKEYPYKKAKQALPKFKSGEVAGLLLSLTRLYHDGHAGKRDMSVALEQFALTL